MLVFGISADISAWDCLTKKKVVIHLKTIYVNWGNSNVLLTWKPAMTLTSDMQVTSVHAVCIQDGKVILSHVLGRGYCLPGGHVELGETNEQALHRELYEEAYIRGEVSYIGCIEVSHEENPNFDPSGKYPLIGYQAMYRVEQIECLPFLREFEAKARIWVEPTEIEHVVEDHALIFDVINAAFNERFLLK